MSSSNYKVYDSEFQEYRKTYWDILTVCVKSSKSPKVASFSKKHVSDVKITKQCKSHISI